MRSFFGSLRFRLIALVSAALLPVLGAMVYDGLEDRRLAITEAQGCLQRLVALVAREQDQKTLAARHLLMGLAQVPAVRRQDAPNCNVLFARLITKSSIFLNVGAITRHGQVFASGLPLPRPYDASDSPAFQTAMKTRDFTVGDLQIGRIAWEPVIVYAYPVLDETGEVQTVPFVTTNMAWLNDLAVQARLPAGSVLAIIDDHGAMIAKHPNPEKWTRQSLPKGGLLDLILNNREGVGETVGIEGVPRLYAFTPLGREFRKGYVYAGIPTQVIYAAANRVLRRNLVILGVTLLLTLGIAWAFARRWVMRPIDVVVQAAKQMAGGDLRVRAGLTRGPEEFCQLAHAFDHMAASLEQRETQRQQAEEAIREQRQIFEFILEQTLAGYWYRNFRDGTGYFSPTFKMMFGYEDHELPNEPLMWQKLIFPEDIPGVLELLRQHIESHGEVPFYNEVRYRHKNGSTVWVICTGRVIEWDEQEQPVRLVGCHVDITGRKQAEKEVRREKEVLQTILDNAPIMTAFLSPDGVHKWINRAWERTLGWSLEESQARDMLQEFYPDPEYRQQVLDFIQKSKGTWGDFEMRRRDGTVIDTSWANVSLSDGSNIGIGLDISARKQAEKGLLNQIQFNETLLQTIPIPVFYKDSSGRYLGCNRAFEEIFGKTREEIIGKEVYGMGPPEIAEKYAAMDQELFERPSSQTYEWKVRSTDGSEREVIFHKASFLDAGGKIAGLIGVILDITERKRTEEALRESEECYRELFDNISSGVAIYEVRDNGNDFVFKDFNKAGERLDGDLRENLVGKSIYEVRSGIEGFGLLDIFRRVWKTGIAEHFPAKIYQDERLTRWYENFVYRLPSGEVVAVYDDVTERKEAEKEIARLASFPQLNPNPVIEVDTGGNITFANPAALEIVQKLGLQGPESLLPPVLEQFLKASMKKGKGQLSLEMEKRGVIFAVYIYFTPQFQVARLFFIDITEGKRAEEERKLNEARLAGLLRISQYPAASTQDLLDYALDEAIILTGSKIGYIYIYDEATEQFTLSTWSKDVMKECTVADPPTVYQLEKTGIWGEAVRQARPIVVNDFQASHPLKKGYPEGHVKLYKYLTIPVFSHNRIAVVVGVANKTADYIDADVRQLTLMMDAVWKIVERQQAEEKLQTAVNKWRTTFDAIGDAICLLNQDFTILQCNEAMANLLEKPFTEILGRHCWELVHGTSQPIQDCPLVRMRQTRQREELLLPMGDRWFKVVVDPILDEDGTITGAVQVISDITHLRKAERAIQRRSQELSLLNTVSSLMLRSMDLDTVLRSVLEVVQQNMFQGKGMVIVFLRDKQTGGLKAAGHRGAPLDHPCLTHPLQVGECYCERAAQQGEMVISRQGCQYRQPGSHQPDMPHQDICLPMKVQDRILGVLHLDLPLDQKLDESDLKLLGAITDQISVAVEKVRLFDEVQFQGSQLRALTARLAEIEEAERRHLARELHDHVGQSLTTLSLTLSMVKEQIPRGVPANVAALLMDAETLVSKTTDSVRDVMSELRPPVLDDYGLMAALRWYGNEFSQRMRIAVEVQGEEAATRLAPEVAMAMFRIAQEALNNVAKHAQASRVTLTGEVHNSSFRLVIADNGIGFDQKQVGQPEGRYCWGLMTMSERATGAGGSCRIESQPGQGTRVVVEVSR